MGLIKKVLFASLAIGSLVGLASLNNTKTEALKIYNIYSQQEIPFDLPHYYPGGPMKGKTIYRKDEQVPTVYENEMGIIRSGKLEATLRPNQCIVFVGYSKKTDKSYFTHWSPYAIRENKRANGSEQDFLSEAEYIREILKREKIASLESRIISTATNNQHKNLYEISRAIYKSNLSEIIHTKRIIQKEGLKVGIKKELGKEPEIYLETTTK